MVRDDQSLWLICVYWKDVIVKFLEVTMDIM